MDITLIKLIWIYLVGALSFIVVDAVWLGKISPKLYKENIGHLMADKPNLLAAGLFYGIFLIGLLAFVVVPALNKESLWYAVGFGALFGLVTYSTFDLTAQAVLKNWPVKITVIDLVWGIILCTLVSTITYLIASKYIV